MRKNAAPNVFREIGTSGNLVDWDYAPMEASRVKFLEELITAELVRYHDAVRIASQPPRRFLRLKFTRLASPE